MNVDLTNSDRARRIMPALELTREQGWEPGPFEDPDHGHQALKDLLTDLRHLADRIGVDFDAADLGAARMYAMELDEDEAGDWAPLVERA